MAMLSILIFGLFAPVLAVDVRIDSLPISTRFKPLKEGLTLADRDRARFKTMFTRHEKRDQSVSLTNTGLEYTLNVGIGTPPTYYELLVDTGSEFTWIGAGKKYVKTKTSIEQGVPFEIDYVFGSAVGSIYKDFVTLSPSLKAANVSFGVTSTTKGVNFDGTLGLGPGAFGTLSNGKPTFMNTLLSQQAIKQNVFGLSFAPTTSQRAVNGDLTFGGTNPQKYAGKLKWIETTKKVSLSRYWGFEQTIKVQLLLHTAIERQLTRAQYGNRILQPSSTGVLDAGTALIYITHQAFEAYCKSLPGSKIDSSTGLLEIPEASVGKMKSLFFLINKVSYEFTPNAQLWPRKLNGALGGDPDAYYSVIYSLGNLAVNTEIEFINGYAFMERFYTAYDLSKSRIGFANTPLTHANIS
ncbi:hypothetical protein RSOLAG22IIIB_09046 [Rhizoctonia solani]|uniref:Peptidase A1 domain-containing protein n=1 Tax=Rhizoctonia solani TaxID=456999 RepID=A0A0K6FWL1_9AGAM|nr:hypothetical protein RSOLAG22IIIB_09046 [Rhizoctonia solani]